MKRILLLAVTLAVAAGSAAPGGEKQPDYRKLVNQGAKRLQQAKTCYAEITWNQTPGSSVRAQVYVQKPRFIHHEWTHTADGETQSMVYRDDGTRGIQVEDGKVRMDSRNRDVVDRTIRTTWAWNLLTAFFKDERLGLDHLPKRAKFRAVGPIDIGAVRCETLLVERDDYQLYMLMVDPEGTVRGFNSVAAKVEEPPMYAGRLERLVLDQPLPDRILNWQPPTTADSAK